MLTLLTSAFAWGQPAYATAAEGSILGAGASTAIPGRYIVVLKDTAKDTAKVKAKELSEQYRGTLGAVYERTLSGFAVAMEEAQAKRLAADPRVAYVEQDQLLQIADTQENPPATGLDRVDQRALPLDTTYSYDLNLSTAVTVYVVDTGMRITHSDFGGRASDGWDFVNGDAVADDCHGHGTHMGATIGGATYGVAKYALLKAVKAFNCMGVATASSIPTAIEWITMNAARPAVVNMSLAAGCKDNSGNPAPCPAGSAMAIRTAITNSIAAGISYVLAAGNHNIDACGSPFNLVTTAISVGASTNADGKLSESNFGSCVDIWAPGQNITSAWKTGDTDTATRSGSSPAAAHVSGALALMLARPGFATKTPAQLMAQVLAEATNGTLTGLGTGSPNKLLYTSPPPIAGGSSVALARNADGRLTLFGTNSSGNLFVRSQSAANSATWAPWLQSVNTNWYSVCADNDVLNRMKLIGLRRNYEVWHRLQAVVNANAWTSWAQFDGLLNSCAMTAEGGSLYIFGTNALGMPFSRSEVLPGTGSFTPWSVMIGVPALRSVAAERNSMGVVQLFGLSRNGDIWQCWTISANCLPAGWSQLDGSLKSIAAARNATGAITIFGVSAFGQLWRRDSVPGVVNVWFPWEQLDVPANVSILRSVAAEANADGRIELVAVNVYGQVWRRAQTAPASTAYTAWTQLDGSLRP